VKKNAFYILIYIHTWQAFLVLLSPVIKPTRHSHMWVLAIEDQNKDPPPHNILSSADTPEHL